MVDVAGPSSGEFRWVVTISELRAATSVADLVAEGLDRTDSQSAVQLWIRDVHDGDDQSAAGLGFVPYRDLWQLRCRLPTIRSSIETRAFERPDLAELVEVNNRAFDWHPEQGGRSRESFLETMSEPWFEPDGLRLHHIGDRLAGFCWTKVHDEDPPLGEIYVIAVDPDFHGRGLGAPMTLAGLDWLGDRGLSQAMLYVEADNAAANATYRRIGFTHHRTDRAYRRDPRP
jgi:mycothiol synthase